MLFSCLKCGAMAPHPQKHTETGPDVPQQWLRRGALRDQQHLCGRRITVGTSEPASCASNPMHYRLRELMSHIGTGSESKGGRLSRNRHPVRTVSVKGCECLSGIEINRERNKFVLIHFHYGTAFVPVGLAGPGKSASKDASAYPVLKSTWSEAD